MIQPHGSKILNPLYVAEPARRAMLEKEAEGLPSILVSSAAAASAVMMGSGYFNPLTGFMNRAQALRVAERMQMPDGLFWPVPVLNLVHSKDVTESVRKARRIALRDPNVDGHPVLAIQTVEAIETLTAEDRAYIIQQVFRTSDPAHPGVAALNEQGDQIFSGPIEVLNHSYFDKEFPETFRTAQQIRDDVAARGWKTVIAFQTRNPMHRAHEELCKIAMDEVKGDGLVIHMLLGRLKAGDIPADVRDECIRTMVDHYFPPNTAIVSGYGFDMLYAGPREAVLHAVFRQNMGATHLIVGRDHAGVGNYYGAFDAQTIFDTIPAGALDIVIFRGDHTAWSKKLGRVCFMGQHPDHTKDDWVMLSGTKVREMLRNGENLPPEFSRPEVAEVLRRYYLAEIAPQA